MRAALLAAALSLATPLVASDFVMSLPVDCHLGDTCYIQQYMDRDPGPDSRDFTCGTLSYDGHKGTDFALPTLADMARGVNVLAAAPGRVQAVRDNMADVLYSAENAANVEGRECGNGVVLKHANGFETQYCHLKQGSVTVQTGDSVAAGDALGQIGLSGKTQFPHLHLSVRRDGLEIDPFDREMRDSCAADAPRLWAEPVPQYRAGGLIDIGFAEKIPDYGQVKAGTAGVETFKTDSPAIVLFWLAYGLRAGDEVIFEISGTDRSNGPILRERRRIDRTQAQVFRAAGKKRRDELWPEGRVYGRATIWRDGKLLDMRAREIDIR